MSGDETDVEKLVKASKAALEILHAQSDTAAFVNLEAALEVYSEPRCSVLVLNLCEKPSKCILDVGHEGPHKIRWA